MRFFKDSEQPEQKIKSSFMSKFLEWAAKVYMDNHLSMIDFVHWLSAKKGLKLVFVILFSSSEPF